MQKTILKGILILFIFLLIINIFSNITYGQEKLQITYFYSSKCLACKENVDFIDRVSKLDGINLITYNTDNENCYNIQIAYATHFGVDKKDSLTVPYIYYGNKAYELKPEIHSKILDEIIEYTSGNKSFQNYQYTDNEENLFEKILDGLSIPNILLAGFIDGINPCAISLLLVFYSFLFTCNRKHILLISSSFILGIFTANFLFGIGINLLYKYLSGNFILLNSLYIMAIIICFIGIILNTIDIINHGKKDAKNQLPDKIKYRLSNCLKSSAFSKMVVISAFVVGVFVGCIELSCTGQIYFPAIMYMMQNTDHKVSSILMLLGYNVMFIMPLLIITVFAYVIKKPEQIKNKLMKYNWIIKIISNIYFLIMILILINKIL